MEVENHITSIQQPFQDVYEMLPRDLHWFGCPQDGQSNGVDDQMDPLSSTMGYDDDKSNQSLTSDQNQRYLAALVSVSPSMGNSALFHYFMIVQLSPPQKLLIFKSRLHGEPLIFSARWALLYTVSCMVILTLF